QCEAKPLDHRTDLYSLGATYYSLLTGKHPFHDTDSIPQVMYLHCHGPIPDPRSVNPAVPEACARIVARAMAKAPADRYEAASPMIADLQAVSAALSGQTPIALPSSSGPVPSSPAGPPWRPAARGRRIAWAAASVLLLSLAGLAVLVWRP